MIEILAPAGSREAFVAALESGADAIYLGGRLFGARHFAPNFGDEELYESVREAHLRGVAVYVTVNILLDDGEIPVLVDYLRQLYSSGVDAIIVQDFGVACIARQFVPELPLHASTQMTVHNLAGTEFLARHGFSRVVLARELPLEDIRNICQQATIGIETFIHGALCISYSGQCLMSSMIGGRSGNRGKCAQPCRLPYSLVDAADQNLLSGEAAGEYLLSPKDFCAIELLPELIAAGVSAFKIEGRMKRAEYVAIVVDSYRRAVDSYYAAPDNYSVLTQDLKDMEQVFNRGFTTAYLNGRPGRLMMSDRRPNNRGVHIGRVIAYHLQDRTADIKLDEPLAKGDVIEFWVKVGGRTNVTVSSFTVNGRLADYAAAGSVVTLPLPSTVRDGDRVFRTFDSALTAKAREFFTGASPVRRIAVEATVTVTEGRPLEIAFRDSDGNVGVGATVFQAEKALKRPLDEATVAKQVGRLGTTVFELKELHCTISGAVMVPISEINEARRQAVENLEKLRLARYNRPDLQETSILDLLPPAVKPAAISKPPMLIVNVDTLENTKAALTNGADGIMFGGESLQGLPFTADDYRQVVALARSQGKTVVLNTPRIIQQQELPGLKADLALFRELEPDAVSVGNLGTLELTKEITGLKIYGDYPLNIFNSIAVNFFRKQGLVGLTLSPELNFSQIEMLATRATIPLECLVHGYLPLMVSEYCVAGSFLGGLDAGSCTQPCRKGDYWLKDRKDEKFRVITDQFCRMHVLNAKELSMLPHVATFRRMGIERLRIEGKSAPTGHIVKITRLYRELIDSGERNQPVNAVDFSSGEHEDITRGHYFRGVL